MSKKLIYYWYVHKTGWNALYDLHIHFLKRYKERFDEQLFIISVDQDTRKDYIVNVINAIKNIFTDAEIIEYQNDPVLRESKYFYNEIATKLNELGDRWIFFAHNKGIDTWYAKPEILKGWIEGMYFMNLNYIDLIEEQMSHNTTCVIGTYLITCLKAWPWLRYNWHFSGTYWWFNPKRISKLMYEKGTYLPSNNSRYFTEGCWGTCIPDNDKYRKPALGMYEANWRYGYSWMPEYMKIDLFNGMVG